MASDLSWTNVEIEQLSAELRRAYRESKEAYRAYKIARDQFEGMMQEVYSGSIAEGTELKFGYNFGKLSVAIGPKTAKKAKSEVAKQTLAEFLAAQSADGR